MPKNRKIFYNLQIFLQFFLQTALRLHIKIPSSRRYACRLEDGISITVYIMMCTVGCQGMRLYCLRLTSTRRLISRFFSEVLGTSGSENHLV